MTAEEYQRLIDTVAEQVSAPDFFPLNQPENDLHPDPRQLRDELTALRNRVSDIEQRLGMPRNVVREYFSRR